MSRLLIAILVLFLGGCSIPPDNPVRLTNDPIAPVIVTEGDTKEEDDTLLRDDPIAFLEGAIVRYEQEVTGYTAILVKQERIQGKLGPVETIKICFREKPFSVWMDWQEGAQLAQRTLYVANENEGKMLIAPAGWRSIAGVVSRDVDDVNAKRSARYPIKEFGLQMGSLRTLKAWKAARDRKELKIRYLGKKALPQLDRRLCWVVRRVESPSHDPDGIVTSTFYFDTTTSLQLGSILEDEKGELIGSYYFREVKLNPPFAEDTFTSKALRKK